MALKKRTQSEMKEDALAIFQAALDVVEPAGAVTSALSLSGDRLKVMAGKKTMANLDLNSFKRIFIVGAGKATAPMAKAVEDLLGDRVTQGIIVVKYKHGLKLKKTKVLEAGHPVPDEKGVEAAGQIKDLLEQTEAGDLVFSLISGGGSALLPLPTEGLKLEDKQKVTELLLACGAEIHEINTVRKHLSQVKGGQMARLAAPARVVNLMLSDVVGDDMDTIASGPFVPDWTTFDQTAVILAKYRLMKKVPASVRTRLKKGLTGRVPETPKPDDPLFKSVTNIIVASNILALKAAEAQARTLGYKTLILSSSLVGETREVAKVHVAMAREIQATGNPIKKPACLISGGETTVTIKGKGKGGRNQEFALAAAVDLAHMQDVVVFSAGTDGTDGPTDAAGAVADWSTVDRGTEEGLSASKNLNDNNSYAFFKKIGGLVKTGPTRTNVMDVRLVLVQ